MWLDLDRICAAVWLWPDPRSRSRLLSFWSSENCTFLGLAPSPFWHGAKILWLIMIVRDLVYSFLEPDFLKISFSVSYRVTSDFAECRYYRTFKGPYFYIVWGYGHIVGYRYAGIPYVLCMLMWPWPDPRSRSCSDDCQPPFGPLFCLGFYEAQLLLTAEMCDANA